MSTMRIFCSVECLPSTLKFATGNLNYNNAKTNLMIAYDIYKAPPFLLEKMNAICRLLRQGKKEYEQVAIAVEDKDLRSTMLTLAQESNQYAHELSSQMQSLGGIPEMEKIEDPELTDDIKNLYDENEILTFCKMNEKKMVGAYQEILNESYLYEGLRKMVRYQLNELLCTFMQVKQLRSLKFH